MREVHISNSFSITRRVSIRDNKIFARRHQQSPIHQILNHCRNRLPRLHILPTHRQQPLLRLPLSRILLPTPNPHQLQTNPPRPFLVHRSQIAIHLLRLPIQRPLQPPHLHIGHRRQLSFFSISLLPQRPQRKLQQRQTILFLFHIRQQQIQQHRPNLIPLPPRRLHNRRPQILSYQRPQPHRIVPYHLRWLPHPQPIIHKIRPHRHHHRQPRSLFLRFSLFPFSLFPFSLSPFSLSPFPLSQRLSVAEVPLRRPSHLHQLTHKPPLRLLITKRKHLLKLIHHHQHPPIFRQLPLHRQQPIFTQRPHPPISLTPRNLLCLK